jgi:uncharacterized protein (TIGR02996 family)
MHAAQGKSRTARAIMYDTALLAAILDSPDDDLPRLAYADWLEEQGELDRAGFIRMQIDLARWPAWDPRYQRVWALEPDRTWPWGRDRLPGLPKLPGGLRWATQPYGRGFPEKVVGPVGDLLGNADEVFALAPVRSYHFLDASPTTITRLARSPILARLGSLSISSGLLGAGALRELGESPHAVNLETLTLAGPAATGEGLEALVATPLFARLRELDLNRFDNAAAWLASGAARLKGPCLLGKLDLSITLSRSNDLIGLVESNLVVNLTELRLRHCNIEAEGWRRLTRSSSLSGLQVLDANASHPGPGAVSVLLEAPWLANLRRLDLGNAVDDGQMQLLAQAKALGQLTVLELPYSRIGDRGARALRNSPHLTNLVHVDLSQNNLGEAAVLRLVEAPVLAGVVYLDVSGNQISPRVRHNLRRRRGRKIRA